MRLLLFAALVLLLAACRPPGARTPDAAPPEAAPFTVEVVARGLNHPWSLAFLPGGDLLVVEKHGGLRLVRGGRLQPQVIPGGPTNVLQKSDSGLLDVALDPDFATNRRVFIAFIEGTEAANRLSLYRARLDGSALTGGEVIFRSGPDKAQPSHSGGRIVFLADKTLLLTTGDGFSYKEQAQDLSSHLGKLLRLDRDGRPAPGNPFIGRPRARPEIYSYGHRNAMGLLRDPRDGQVWLHENGPKGGDEINRVVAGANYGWPKTSHGVDYSGELISKLQEAPGIEKPVMIWSPSIAPSGFALYLADAFPEWRGDFLVGALADQSLRRVRIRNGAMVLQEVLLKGRKQRIRDVRVGPDGMVYLLTDADEGEVLRLRPAPK